MDWIIEHDVEPVVLSASLAEVLEVADECFNVTNDTFHSIEAVGHRF